MRVLLLGATGRTGRLIMERMQAANHIVTSIGGSVIAPSCAARHRNRPLDMTLLLQASLHHDVVINCLRAPDNPGLYIDIISALEASYKRVRYITVGGLGVHLPTDCLGMADKLTSMALRMFGDRSMTDRQSEADYLLRSVLDWTMLRIPRLVDGNSTNAWILKPNLPVSTHITRSDLADALVECASQKTFSRAAPFLTLTEQGGKLFT